MITAVRLLEGLICIYSNFVEVLLWNENVRFLILLSIKMYTDMGEQHFSFRVVYFLAKKKG